MSERSGEVLMIGDPRMAEVFSEANAKGWTTTGASYYAHFVLGDGSSIHRFGVGDVSPDGELKGKDIQYFVDIATESWEAGEIQVIPANNGPVILNFRVVEALIESVHKGQVVGVEPVMGTTVVGVQPISE